MIILLQLQGGCRGWAVQACPLLRAWLTADCGVVCPPGHSPLPHCFPPLLCLQDVRSLSVTTAANAGHDALALTWAWLQQNVQALFEKLGGAGLGPAGSFLCTQVLV